MDRANRSAYASRAENLVGSGLNDRLFSSRAIVLRAGSERWAGTFNGPLLIKGYGEYP